MNDFSDMLSKAKKVQDKMKEVEENLKKIDEKENFLNKEKESEVFKEMKNIFPDADLIDVEEVKDEWFFRHVI